MFFTNLLYAIRILWVTCKPLGRPPGLQIIFLNFLSVCFLFHATHALSIASPCFFSPLQLHYIHSSPSGSGSANPPVVSTVYAYIGTPPAQRQLSSLVWRLGPTHFLEEVLPAPGVSTIYELGPNYVGSFQAVYVPCEYNSNGSKWLGGV